MASLRRAARHEPLGEVEERADFLIALEQPAGSERHDGAVVHGGLEEAACEDETIDEGDRQAGGGARGERGEQSRGAGSVEDDLVSDARVAHRHDVGLAVGHHGDVRDEPGIQDRVRRVAIRDGLVRQPLHSGAGRRSGGRQVAHSRLPASVRTVRRICSISSKCDWSQIRGGESWMTGSPRSSARQ